MNSPLTTPDRAFLQNLDHVLERHLSDSAFSIRRLLRAVGMSRTDLHRKLERTVKMSATEYVRFVRLRRAAFLMRNNPEWSISTVAFEVGFNSQSYFTRKFKETFGHCPEQWKSMQVNQIPDNTPLETITIKHKKHEPDTNHQ